MSRKSVARMMLGYFVAAFAFAAFTEFQKFATFNFGNPIFATVFVSEAFGGAAALYVISGINPRDRLGLQPVSLTECKGAFSDLGDTLGDCRGARRNIINSELSQLDITGKDRDDPIREARLHEH